MNNENPPSPESPKSGRRADGTFAPGNTEAMTHGAYSQQARRAELPEQAERRAAINAKREEIYRNLGGRENLTELQRDSVESYLELWLIVRFLGAGLISDGPLTTKGNQRAALTAYSGMVDRMQRLADSLGLGKERKSEDAPVHVVVERIIVNPGDVAQPVTEEVDGDTLVIGPEDDHGE